MTGFEGDPFHEGASQPQASLKGGMAMPNTQDPMTSEVGATSRGGNTDAPNSGTWDSTVLAPGHPTNGGSGLYKTPSGA